MKVNGNVGLQQSMRRMLSGAQKMQAMQIRRIASGYRINSAGDDASGLAIGKRINAQITGLSTASMNAKDAISYIQTAEGAMDQVHSITNRMTELATRASNGLLSSTERNMIQAEYKQLSSEIDRIGQSTDFNGLKPFDGSSQQMQVGATAGEQITPLRSGWIRLTCPPSAALRAHWTGSAAQPTGFPPSVQTSAQPKTALPARSTRLTTPMKTFRPGFPGSWTRILQKSRPTAASAWRSMRPRSQ